MMAKKIHFQVTAAKPVLVLTVTLLVLLSGLDILSFGSFAEIPQQLDVAEPAIQGLTLENGELGNACLARYKTYSFNATINDTDGANDIKYVNITIEPDDENITICWSRSNATHFFKMDGGDPSDYVNLSSNDTHWGDLDANNTFVNFRLNFNWTFPDLALCDIRLNVTDGSNNTNSTNYPNLFRVVTGLDISGSLTVTAQHQGSISSGDWVRTSENLTFSGSTVHYTGFPSFYPSNEYFNISVINETGAVGYDNSSSGQPFIILMQSSPVSDNSNQYNVSVNKLPVGRAGNVSANQTFIIRVDGDAPPGPGNITIHADSFGDNRTLADNDTTFFVTWNASVDADSGTRRYYYSFYNTEGNEDTNVTNGNQSSLGDTNLVEGFVTVYVWAEDNVGNIGSSKNDTIILDESAPSYIPPNNVIINGGDAGTNVSNLAFTWTSFIDQGVELSGIDFYYCSFVNNQGTTNGTVDYASPGVLSNAKDGTVNVYVWAMDKAGNIGISATDTIMVDTTDIYFENPSPSPNGWVNESLVTCGIDIRDNTSGVRLNTIEYRYFNGTLSQWISTGDAGAAQQLFSASATVEFAIGGNNYIQWRATDDLTNGPVASQKYTVQVDFENPDNSNADVIIERGAENVGSNNIFFEWSNFTDSGGAGIKGYYYNFTNGSGTPNGVYTANTNATAASAVNGTVTIYVWAVDNAGNIGNATEDSVYIDAFVPDISNAWILINGGDEWTNDQTLHLTWGGFSDPTLTGYYFSFVNGSGAPDANYTADTHADIPNAPARKNVVVYVWAKDAYGHYSIAVSDSIHVDTVRPYFTGSERIRLENGSKFTNDVFVHYNFTGITDAGVDQSGISGYYYAYTNNSGTTNGNFIATTIGVIKVPSDGSKNIWIWGADVAGNLQDRALRATIMLDTVAPTTGSVVLQNDITYWNSSNAQVRWSGFSDENDPISRGIAGYYFSETNNEGTTTGYFSNGGIRAHYYDGINFNDYKGSRYESTINTRYPNGAPWGCGRDTFSVIWNGSIFCPYSETYTFKCGSDDGFRLYIDDIYRMGHWGVRAYAENTASMYLERGFHRFKMHFFENGGGQRVTAKWSSAHINEAIISSYYFWGGQNSDTIPIVGEGNKRVYTWAQDYSQNIGDAVSDDIFIDTIAPSPASANLKIENDSQYCSDKTLYLNWSGFTDPAPSSQIKGYYISFFDGNGTDNGIWTNKTKHTLAAPEGNHHIYVWAEDVAGNRGLAVNDTIEVIYPKVLDITHEPIAYRGKTIPITMNLTDVVFGETGLNLTLQIWLGEAQGGWNELPVDLYDDGELIYWYSSYTPPLDVPINTILDLRLRYTNPGGFISAWQLKAFKAVNNFPMINSTPTFTSHEDHAVTVDFNEYGWDVEDGNDPYLTTWSIETFNKYKIGTVTPGDVPNKFVFDPLENFHGNSSVLMRITDKDGDYQEEYFNFSWENVNDRPMVFDGVLQEIHLVEDNDTLFQIDTGDIFYDIDGDPLEINFTNSTNILINFIYPGIANITTAHNWYGQENITFIASDGQDEAYHTISFIVSLVNDPPDVIGISKIFTMDEDTTGYIDIGEHFSDPDDLELLYVAQTVNAKINISIMENNSLRVEPALNWFGLADISVSAIDPSGEMNSFTFTVEVLEVNDVPIAFIEPRSKDMEKGGGDMKLSGWGVDESVYEKGTIRDYRWNSSVDGFLGNLSVLDLRVRHNISQGLHIITFRVQDDDGAWSEIKSIEIFITAPLLEVIIVPLDKGEVMEGNDVHLKVHIRNNGTATAKNVNVTFMVDGNMIKIIWFPNIFPGETRTATAIWEAEAGKHNISVVVKDSKYSTVTILDEGQMNMDIEVKQDASFLAFLFSIVLAFVIIIAFFVISAFLRKRRRKKVLLEVKKTIREANGTGVGVQDAQNMLEELENEFRIRLK